MTAPADSSASVEIQGLLDHTDWLRRLALQLVDDPSRADDVVQQSYLEALRRPPRRIASARGWLARVARNVAAATGRSDDRRRRREALVARPEACGDSDPVVSSERVAMQRELMDAVLSLRQPYRDVIVLRFFEGLPQRQIAKRLARPVTTIDTQLQRGLAWLRVRFDGRHGARSTWILALAPIVRSGHGASALGSGSLWTAGGLLMTWKLAAPVAAAGGSLALLFWLFDGEPAAGGPTNAAKPEEIARAATAAPPDPASEAEASRAQAVASVAPPEPVAEAADVVTLVGHVHGVDGVSSAGVELEWRDPRRPRWTQQDSIRWQNGSEAISWQPFRGRIGAERDFLRGQLSGPDGLSALRKRLPEALQAAAAELHAALRGQPVGPRVISDASGAFEVGAEFRPSSRDVFAVADERMVYGAGRVSDGGPDAGDYVVMVGPAARVFGRVVDSRDRPVPGASVELLVHPDSTVDVPDGAVRLSRMWSTTTNEDGWFDLGRAPSARRLRVSVYKEGYEHDESLSPAKLAGQPALVRLKLRPEAKAITITGRVVGPGGRPVAEATVAFGKKQVSANAEGHFEMPLAIWEDTTSLIAFAPGFQLARIDSFGASLRQDQASASAVVLRLGPAPLSIRGRVLTDAGDPLTGWKVVLLDGTPRQPFGWVEDGLAADDKNSWGGAETDADGRFELGGLNAKGYRLRAFDPLSLTSIDSAVVPAGATEVVFRRSAHATHEVLEGEVVDARGRPVHGVAIRLHLRNARSPIYVRDRGVTTDVRGRFLMRDVPRAAAEIRFSGHGKLAIAPVGLPLDGSQVSPLRIVVARQLRVHLVTASADDDRVASFLDGQGKILEAVVRTHTRARKTTRVALGGMGEGAWIALPTTARTLALHRGEGEVYRQPLPTTLDSIHELRLP